MIGGYYQSVFSRRARYAAFNSAKLGYPALGAAGKSYTIEMRFRQVAISSQKELFSMGTSPASTNSVLLMRYNSNGSLFVANFGASTATITGYNDLNWHTLRTEFNHLTGERRTWVDGDLKATEIGVTALTGDTASAIGGRVDNSNTANNLHIDYVKVWAAGALVLHIPFDGNLGVKDISPNNYNGQVTTGTVTIHDF